MKPEQRVKSAGYIEAQSNFPKYRYALTHVKNSILKISRNKQEVLLALAKDSESFYIISTPSEQGSTEWFRLMQDGRSLGLKLNSFYTCEPSVLSAFIAELIQEVDPSQLASDRQDDLVLKDIVDSSDQLNWLSKIIMQCIDLGASDLHWDIRATTATLKIRRDGVIRVINQYPSHLVMQAMAVSYTMLAEERSRSEVAFNPNGIQSAMIPLTLQRGSYLLRYQSHPIVGGLDVVMRILKNDVVSIENAIKIEKLGYTESQIIALNNSLASATGGIFLAGITGSGKTTTLNAMLSHLALDGQRKIISIEDPVEYQIPGVSHFSIQRKAVTNTTDINPFVPSMMAFLRMDPDIGMFGEIRDSVSAEMAFSAIQTGHKLLTTVHATSALGIISRLSSPLIGLLRVDICNLDFLSALVYQTLIPMNCPHCNVAATEVMSAEHLNIYEMNFKLDISKFRCASTNGCSHCCPPQINLSERGHNGIKGMKVGAEVIVPDTQLIAYMSVGNEIEARKYWRSLQTVGFDHPDMLGKPAWAHTLFDVANGLIDPYYFEYSFGKPSTLLQR